MCIQNKMMKIEGKKEEKNPRGYMAKAGYIRSFLCNC
jgi:hypothetical protein